MNNNKAWPWYIRFYFLLFVFVYPIGYLSQWIVGPMIAWFRMGWRRAEEFELEKQEG